LSRWLVSVCLGAVLLGCATPDTEQTFSSPTLSDRGLSEDDLRIVEAAVRPLLKNPTSAQFRAIGLQVIDPPANEFVAVVASRARNAAKLR